MAVRGGWLQAAIFDMDGVITRTDRLHAAAWKSTFDDMLRQRAEHGGTWQPFDEHAEYRAYVDGKPRQEGVRTFLRAREITLPEQEIASLAERKDAMFEQLLREKGVQTYPSTLALIEALRAKGIKTAVVTSSRHGREVLRSAKLIALFDVCLDGNDLAASGLKGKPNPDIFLRAAELLEMPPRRMMVVEDAVAGVQAARLGNFNLVVGIDRGGNAEALARAGADIVVTDAAALSIDRLDSAFRDRQEKAAWRIEQEGFDAARERQMESLFLVGNGYLGVRGALDTPLPGSQADLFIAGLYDRKRAALPYSEIEFLAPERDDPYAELVPLPFPFRLAISVEDVALDFSANAGRELRRSLDMRQGTLHTEAVYETEGGRRTTVRTSRCASLANAHVLLQEVVITPENHWATVSLDVALIDPDMAARHPHIECIAHIANGDMELVHYATRASGFHICLVSRVWRETNSLRRIISVFTSRDGVDPVAAATAQAEALRPDDFVRLLGENGETWADFWFRADVRVTGRASVEQALRFGSYHLRLAASDDARVSIGARTLSGRAYEGHVFWDAEIFMLPFYLHTDPRRARNLLLYRHHTLDGARRRARGFGCNGACFAWESTVTGDDVTPSHITLKSTGKEIPIYTGRQQIHITADVAYAAWRYWEMSGDDDFLAGPGADLLCETARFWASRVVRGDRHYHIRGVVGPDEYHHSVNDNAYTNWMARFNLDRAAVLAKQLGMNQSEAEEWTAIAQALYVPPPNEHGVIEQFEGFFALEDMAVPGEARFKVPAGRLFEWERINHAKLLKQADVLMLPLLFPDAFTDAVVAANYRYYEPITDHGSSLSPPVHAAIAARIGAKADAERYLKQSLWLDLSDTMGNSTLGVHPATMGGIWQALVFGFLGVRFDDSGPRADAAATERLPEGWEGVTLRLAHLGRTHTLEVRRPAKGEVPP
ncbi:beta-phosphoglucomutase family hydrolase [Noviherbaspirillum denitrificans]|uniref:Beta-phosphoglucomutase n=1 Tax=Noviherbaspirillum denitrificans TaxID=1968433 RepID=A0A254TG73_9BURK|nr:beta-phosphoglucomutase family hydrolase [Noviherbaspirillum denitrificans]OWW21167.1 hypothetical protein AYR66_18480 [Noviherbaspirillum denitrificans]